jgi:hypothetical protein
LSLKSLYGMRRARLPTVSPRWTVTIRSTRGSKRDASAGLSLRKLWIVRRRPVASPLVSAPQ